MWKKLLAVPAALTLASQGAFAALPAGVAAGVTTATTDGVEAVGIMSGLAVAVFVIYKVLKRLGVA